MVKRLKRVALGPDTDLFHILEEVHTDKVPRLIERDGEALAVVVDAQEYQTDLNRGPKERQVDERATENTEDIWAGYDPEKVREALRKSAGALLGVDRETLLADIYEARGQASQGRPE